MDVACRDPRERDELLEQMNAAYEKQRADKTLIETEEAERSIWHATVGDGLRKLGWPRAAEPRV